MWSEAEIYREILREFARKRDSNAATLRALGAVTHPGAYLHKEITRAWARFEAYTRGCDALKRAIIDLEKKDAEQQSEGEKD